MRIASETVWATAKGELVKAGDPDSAVLVAAKGHPVADKKLAQFGKSDLNKFFKDATFDRHGGVELPDPIKPAKPVTIARLDTVKETKAQSEEAAELAAKKAKGLQEKREQLAEEGPGPQNREAGMKVRKRGKKSKK